MCGELQYIARDAVKGCGQVYIKMKAHKVADMLDRLQQQRDADRPERFFIMAGR